MHTRNGSVAFIAVVCIAMGVLIAVSPNGKAKGFDRTLPGLERESLQAHQVFDPVAQTSTEPAELGLIGPSGDLLYVGPKISTGAFHTCAVLQDGIVKCWGENSFGALGDGTTTNRLLPTRVIGLTTGASKITTGAYHSCVLLLNGEVACWGRNDKGQLGDGTTINRSSPVKVLGLSEPVTAIDASYHHTCALMTSGTVKCWGDGSFGQLGNGLTENSTTPVGVLNLTDAVAITTGGYHSCVVLSDGTANCWGQNDLGQLGDTTNISRTSPVSVRGITGVTGISAGYGHTCATLNDGALECWGLNDDYQIGDGTNISRYTPMSVAGLATEVIAVDAGYWHTCALGNDGSVSCWGLNVTGQLGDGTEETRNVPVQVIGLTSSIVEVSAGGGHTCALTGDGGVECWGNNANGQLGIGSTESQTTPVELVLVRSDAPTLTNIAPPSIQAGSSGLTLTVTGTVFEPGDQVRLNGVDKTSTFIAPNQLNVQLSADDIQTAGNFPLTVVHPDSTQASNSLPLTVYTFADVVPPSWYYGYVEGLYAKGITGGCAVSPLRYCPDNQVTRAQMAVFLLKGKYGSDYVPPAASGTSFSDVPVTYWAAAWIEKLAAEGITTGCSAGLYCPQRPVTRAQMAVFIDKTFGIPLEP